MKYLIIAIVLVFGVMGLILLSPKADSKQPTTQLSIQSIERDVAKGAQFLDVRTPEEYMSGHIDGATNWSLQTLQAGSLPTSSKSAPIYVYCHSGNRSSQATQILSNAGFTHVIDLGAITHVQQLGGKIVKA